MNVTLATILRYVFSVYLRARKSPYNRMLFALYRDARARWRAPRTLYLPSDQSESRSYLSICCNSATEIAVAGSGVGVSANSGANVVWRFKSGRIIRYSI